MSCCSGDQWRRTKLHFWSGESLDDHHRSTTLGATPKIVRGRSVLIRLRLLCCSTEQVKAQWQEYSASPVGQEAEVEDTHEACGK